MLYNYRQQARQPGDLHGETSQLSREAILLPLIFFIIEEHCDMYAVNMINAHGQ